MKTKFSSAVICASIFGFVIVGLISIGGRNNIKYSDQVKSLKSDNAVLQEKIVTLQKDSDALAAIRQRGEEKIAEIENKFSEIFRENKNPWMYFYEQPKMVAQALHGTSVEWGESDSLTEVAQIFMRRLRKEAVGEERAFFECPGEICLDEKTLTDKYEALDDKMGALGFSMRDFLAEILENPILIKVIILSGVGDGVVSELSPDEKKDILAFTKKLEEKYFSLAKNSEFSVDMRRGELVGEKFQFTFETGDDAGAIELQKSLDVWRNNLPEKWGVSLSEVVWIYENFTCHQEEWQEVFDLIYKRLE